MSAPVVLPEAARHDSESHSLPSLAATEASEAARVGADIPVGLLREPPVPEIVIGPFTIELMSEHAQTVKNEKCLPIVTLGPGVDDDKQGIS